MFRIVLLFLLLWPSITQDLLISKRPQAFLRDPESSSPESIQYTQIAQSSHDQLILLRQLLHRNPELMYQEAMTSEIIKSFLTKHNIKYTSSWGKNTRQSRIPGEGGHGVVATIGTGNPPCLLLRADIDALPILEVPNPSTEAFKSRNHGEMHACGHDGHTSMLLVAASELQKLSDQGLVNGTIRVMFQPAEEGGAGGKRMREEGVLEMEPVVERAFGMHLWPTLPSGAVGGRAGVMLAACDRFVVEISGVGGHAAMPHLVQDPILAMSGVIQGFQSIVSRRTSPLDAAVVSVTKVDGGSAFNVIPELVEVWGTIRSLSTEGLLELKADVEVTAKRSAAAYGCNVTVTWSPDFYPATVNDPDLWESFASGVGASVADGGRITNIDPTMGAEDFSFVAEAVPSAFFLLGQGSGKDPVTSYGLHHPQFSIDEDVLVKGVELHMRLAMEGLADLWREREEKQKGM